MPTDEAIIDAIVAAQRAYGPKWVVIYDPRGMPGWFVDNRPSEAIKVVRVDVARKLLFLKSS